MIARRIAAGLLLLLLIVALVAQLARLWGNWDTVYAERPSSRWLLVGGVTHESVQLRVQWPDTTAILYLSKQPDPRNDPVAVVPLMTSNSTYTTNTTITLNHGVYAIAISGLEPQTTYYYGVVVDDNQALHLPGTFRTPTHPGTPYSFKVAFGGCAWTGSDHAVFDEIRNEHLDAFFHLGDLHYFDYQDANVSKRIDAVSTVLNAPRQAQLYRSTTLSYVWDDHDYTGNDGFTPDGGELARESALQAYHASIPHHPLDDPSGTPYHAFTMGSVRFIVSDLRSEANRTTQRVYSDEQAEWLRNELAQASQYDFVVWITSKPWIGDVDFTVNHDAWFGAPEDRRALSDYITETIANGPQNLLAVSADAHSTYEFLSFCSGCEKECRFSPTNLLSPFRNSACL